MEEGASKAYSLPVITVRDLLTHLSQTNKVLTSKTNIQVLVDFVCSVLKTSVAQLPLAIKNDLESKVLSTFYFFLRKYKVTYKLEKVLNDSWCDNAIKFPKIWLHFLPKETLLKMVQIFWKMFHQPLKITSLKLSFHSQTINARQMITSQVI